MQKLLLFVVLAAFLLIASADVYLHSPRGANDRCDEKSNNRNNEQRGWDSENNAAGGYAICDKEMFFYVGTVLSIQWYSQHNCGNGAVQKTNVANPELVTCEIVIQLGCEPDFALYENSTLTYNLTDGISLGRPGADQYNTVTSTNTPWDTFGDTCTETKPTTATCQQTGQGQDNPTQCNTDLSQGTGTFNSDTCQCSPRKMQTYMYHEPEAWYDKCYTRQRNQGLFTADQNPSNNQGATATRQEPNSARYGFECTEERDYWPYWHPTPWRDLVVLTSDVTMCPFYQSNSQNVMNKCECLATSPTATWEDQYNAMQYNQEVFCTGANFQWVCHGSWNWTQPDCILSFAQSDNMLGRVDTRGDNKEHVDGSQLAFYDWTIPSSIIPKGQDSVRCLIRLRYNLSNAEVTQNYDSSDNNLLSDNPVHTVGAGNASLPSNQTFPLRMAINTAQYGRTFQDRTYTFSIRQRPSNLTSATIRNVNVRGKRGNIAQVRNCFEYDFVPNMLTANIGDYIHFQWCGSDYNDNGNAGNGRDGTDRTNIIQIGSFNGNIVQPFNLTAPTSIFSQQDLQNLAWIGQQVSYCYTTSQMLTSEADSDQDPQSCHFLNGVVDSNGMPTAYFSYLAKVIRSGTFQYIGSRNNDFTNRSQKGQIQTGGLSAGAIAGVVIGSVAGAAAIVGLGVFGAKKAGLSFSSLSFSNKV